MAPRVLTRELALYTLLSAVALAVDTGAFTGLLGMGAAWPWAAGVGFAAGLLVSYTGSTLFVFHQHRLTDRRTSMGVGRDASGPMPSLCRTGSFVVSSTHVGLRS